MKNLLPRLFSAFLAVYAILSFLPAHSGDVTLQPGRNRLTVLSGDFQALRISSEFNAFTANEVKTASGTFTRITVPGFSPRGFVGSPELPADSRLIEVPAGAEVSVRIISKTVTEYRLADLGIFSPVYPKQPPIPKTGEEVELAYQAGAYLADRYYNDEPVTVEILGSMRGTRIARLDVAPVMYNPVRQTLHVWEKLEFEVVFAGGDAAQTEQLNEKYSSPYFEPVFHGLLNHRSFEPATRDTITRYPVKYVIVADPMFESQLQPLVEWKTMKGFQVVEAYTNDPNVGSTTYSIKAYLQSLYDNATPEDPAPTFVLFVGDIDQVPTWTGQAASHVTDLYYVEYTGDLFPEIYYGRFSAQNTAQLQPQIDKTLMYEQFTMPDPSYLEEVVMIAGMDGTFGPVHGNGQINYGTINYFNEAHDLLSHTYLYPESGSNSANIIQNVSDGVGFANYTAHGSPSGWADPSFSVGDIAGLQNNGKYGLLIGNCCSTSEYQVSECFGEALLRAANKGALGYIGASNSTYWDEDYYFGVGVGAIAGNPPAYEETTLGNYDRAFHDHGEPWEDWYTTMGQSVYAGNLAVTLGAPGSAEYYWEAYCLMGDPSVMPYYGVPDALEATYDALLPIGTPTFTVTTVPYAYAALSMDGTLLGAALADATGTAVIPVSGVTTPGIADVVVTAQNYQPFMGTVLIANPEGPYVVLNEVVLQDGNNGMAEPGETISLDTELKNWGNEEAVSVTAVLSLPNGGQVEITDDLQEFGTIAAQDSSMQAGAYVFVVDDSIPDQAKVFFDLAIQDQTRETWTSSFNITLNAPVLSSGGLNINDYLGGNDNGRLDPGESVVMVLEVNNTGHCDASDLLTTLTSASPYFIINTSSITTTLIGAGESWALSFEAQVKDNALIGGTIDVSFHTTSGPYSCQSDYILPVGMVIEDFETGNFTAFGWHFTGDQSWMTTTGDAFEGDYSAVSGDIGDSQTSTLYLDFDVPVDDSISFYRKVSCEDDPSNDDYDWLAFYIDDEEQARWDGEVAWSQVSFPVTEGTHTFKWVYNKDYSVSAGSDAAWIDYIIFPGLTQYVSIGESGSRSGMTLNVSPNPVKTYATATFSLEHPSEITLNILDLAGRVLVKALPATSMEAGSHSLGINTAMLPQGSYLLVLQTSQGQAVTKLIKQ